MLKCSIMHLRLELSAILPLDPDPTAEAYKQERAWLGEERKQRERRNYYANCWSKSPSLNLYEYNTCHWFS